jgi:hypothetical protein
MIRELAWSEDRGKVVVVPGAPDNPVNIPHDIEYRGLATGIDQKLNPEVSGVFGHHRRSQNRPGSASQGGDTGSNPVGTTSGNEIWALTQIHPISTSRNGRPDLDLREGGPTISGFGL